MHRLSSEFRRLVAYTVGGVAVLAFALALRALFATQSQPITANVLTGEGPLGTTFFMEDGDQLQPAWSPDGRYLAYLTIQTDGPHLFRRDLLTNEVVQLVDHALNPIWSPDGARLAYERPVGNDIDLYVTDAGGVEHVKVNDTPNPIGVQWLPDGQSLLFSARAGVAELHIVAADGSGGRVVIVPDVWALSVSDISSDGRRAIGSGMGIASQTPTGLINIDLQTGEFSSLLPFDDLAAGNGLWSPDGQHVAYYTPDPNPSLGSTLRVTRLADGESHTFFAANLAQFAWSPDSRFIAFNSSTGFQGNELIIGWADGSRQVPIAGLTLNSFAWSPDGSQIAVSARNADQADIAIIRADEAALLAYLDALQATPTPLPFPTSFPTPTPFQDFDFYWPTRLTDDLTGNYRPAVSPDGSRIAFASERDGNWDIYLFDLSSQTETRLTNDPLNDMAPSWSPDGTRIAYQHNIPDASGPVLVERIVMNADGSGKTVVSSDAVWIGNEAPAWSQSGDRIAFSDGKGVTVVGVTDHRKVKFAPSDTSAYVSPAWIDDRHVAFVQDGQLSIGDTTSGAVTPVPAESGFARLPLTTRASYHIAYFALDDGARLIMTSPDGGGSAVLAQLFGSNIQHAAWSPDGRFIAYYVDDSIQVSIAWTNAYETDAPLFTIPNVTASLSDLVGVAWLPDSSGFVYVAENEGQPDLYLATLNQQAIQAYADYFPIYAATQIAPPMPTPPPPPTMFPQPTSFGGSPTPFPTPPVAVPPGASPYWLQLVHYAGGIQVAVAGQYVWLVDENDSVLFSYDAGATWSSIALPPATQRIAVRPHFDGTDLFAAAADGVYRSAVDQAGWQLILAGGPYASVAASADGTLFAAERLTCRVHRSTDAGATWIASSVMANGCMLANVIVSPQAADGEVVYALTDLQGLWRSTDRGTTWQSVGGEYWFDAAIDPVDSALVYAANGETLARFDTGGGGRDATFPVSFATALAVGPDQSVYIGDASGRVYASRDQGATWSEISTFSGESIRSLAAVDKVVYVLTESSLIGGYWEGAPVPATPTPSPPILAPTPVP